jgi:alanine-glyoxylate transaminase/serine-glyoxylate transaminase/serine-pyruvate transaminase
LPTVNTIKIPAGFPWAKVNGYLMEKYAIEIAGGLGPSAGQVWRVGLMGYNCTEINVKLILEKLKEAIEAQK